MKMIIRKIKNKLKHILDIFLAPICYKSVTKKINANFLNDNEVINEITQNGKSLSRFGDGELKWMFGIKQNSFQDYDENLKNSLFNAFFCKDTNLLIALPKGIKDVSEYTDDAKKMWRYFTFVNRKNIIKLMSMSTKCNYSNTNITRPYIDYRDKNCAYERFQNIKKIWQNRDVIIIEGEKTRISVGNDLMENAKSIKRVIAPSKNAYRKIDEIYNFVIENCDKNDLILLALGPTATVLSYKLCIKGFQSVDIGHIDVEYEWFNMGVTKKVPIKSKYVNEARGIGDLSDEKLNGKVFKEYQMQIIKEIL